MDHGDDGQAKSYQSGVSFGVRLEERDGEGGGEVYETILSREEFSTAQSPTRLMEKMNRRRVTGRTFTPVQRLSNAISPSFSVFVGCLVRCYSCIRTSSSILKTGECPAQ